MKKRVFIAILAALPWCYAPSASAKTWTLEECIQYAMDNNITLRKAGVSRLSAAEDTKLSKAQLLPSLNFSTNQNMSYTPWKKSGTATVAGGQVASGVDKVTYNGQYTVNANWTVWNGNRNRNQVVLNSIAEQQAEMDSVTSARNIEEQIAQLYIQILYTKDAIEVNKATLEAARVNEERGRQMLEVGQISKADLSQLTAQRAQDEYNVVQAESQARTYTRQLKELLQITGEEVFDVAMPDYTDDMALQGIPTMASVYTAALDNRPELKRAQLSVQSAEVQSKIAKAQRMPTVSMSASVGALTNSLNSDGWASQMKANLNVGAGVTVSVPIFDQRSTRTAINKANLQKQEAMLDIQDKQTALYSTIENYWIQAGNYQNQYKAAKVSTQSAQDSYDLLSEQFAVGLKNIVELQDGKTRLLSARQSELQSKYMTILNIKMLEFYKK
ncbi:MAG: TolC family protein [Prevotellaceae bacterium]|nr:TolC family protein [Prevotellaceae bacterium]MDY2750418.1 TolC family protein [Prevotella sp.]